MTTHDVALQKSLGRAERRRSPARALHRTGSKIDFENAGVGWLVTLYLKMSR